MVISSILDACKKTKNRLAEARQKDLFASQSTTTQYSQERILTSSQAQLANRA